MRVPRNLLRLFLVFSLWLGPFETRLEAGDAAQRVQLRIGSILASNKTGDCDPKLAKLDQLKVFKYPCYRLLREDSQNATWNVDATFEIPGGRSLIVTPQERRDNQLSLKVRLIERGKPVSDTTVRLKEGGNFLLGGPPHEGGVLILSISAASS